LESGDVLTLTFDNPSSGESIIAMCDSDGNEILDRIEEGGVFRWRIRKA
jgi:tRNA 2-thiouridine synthesizing protein A